MNHKLDAKLEMNVNAVNRSKTIDKSAIENHRNVVLTDRLLPENILENGDMNKEKLTL
jgi:hypothetical protein